MSTPHKLTRTKMTEVIELRKTMSPKELAAKYGVSPRTIKRRLATWDRERRVDRKPNKRRTKLTTEEISEVIDFVKVNNTDTKQEILSRLDLNICEATLTRYLKKFTNFKQFVSPKKFYVNQENRDFRARVATLRSNWTQDYWNKIVFCDEFGICDQGKDRIRVWRARGSRYEPENIIQYVNQKRRLNGFAYISRQGTHEIIFYDRMNSEQYCHCITIMIEDLKKSLPNDDFLILHDNARFSTSKETISYLKEKDYMKYFVKIPPYSPDMNIIENAFGILKKKFRDYIYRNGQQQNREEMINIIQIIWRGVGEMHVESLYNSLEKRMQDIRSANGGPTRW